MPDAAAPVKTRREMAPQFQWNLARIYTDDSAFEKDFARLDELAAPLLALRGKLTSASAVAEFFKAEDVLDRLAAKLSVYCSMRSDEDTADGANQERKKRVRARTTELAGKLAWARPELLSHPIEKLKAWEASAELAPYRRSMTLLIREKAHTLGEAEETLLSRAREIFGAPYETFSLFANADLTFPPAHDSAGKAHEVTAGRYINLLMSPDRTLRRTAFESKYDTYKSFRNTVASTLSSAVKVNNYIATTRKHPSALEASLHPDNIPVSVVDTLVSATHDNLPAFFKYVDLRRKALKIDKLDMYDFHVPIVPEYELKVPYDQAVQWVRDALKPMGSVYAEAVEECFRDGWVDVYENKGKRSGAYSSGSYDTAPYILLNYSGTLNDVFTLAHELGHSVHSWLSKRAQSFRDSDYTIFVAEIASTTAEALLHEHLMATSTDARLKTYLVNHLCDSFKGTVYRQTMFSEFERQLHEADAAGIPLTADWIEENYYKLNAAFYGPSVQADQRIGMEWARIPHFYYNFYVYKYATGFCAAQIFCQRILSGAEKRDQYIEMLKAGGNDDPLDIVRKGGVDLADRAVLNSAFRTFDKAVDELARLLGA